MLKKIIKYSLRSLIIILFLLFSLPFIISPVYDFPEPEPFSGDKIWNPYEGMVFDQWKKGNFQIQSLAWGGITDGRKNPTDTIIGIYNALNYDIIGISDYMKINRYNEGKEGYIPIYEHGINYKKTHQVNIGTDKVIWLDFPFVQTLSHKQFIINVLRKHTDVLALAHPAFHFEGYSKNDLKYLTNYDLIEALNHQVYSLEHWDAALSAGNAKYILANDDAHDITNPYLVGVVSTYINAPGTSREEITEAMKAGKTYGFIPRTPTVETYEHKIRREKFLPVLLYAGLIGDTLTVMVDYAAQEIRFIGQDSDTLKTIENWMVGKYRIKESDPYVRVEIAFRSKETIYLNPFIRYSGEKPETRMASVNYFKTIAYRGSYTLVFVLLLIYLTKRWKKDKYFI
jgi:hypothetical protein